MRNALERDKLTSGEGYVRSAVDVRFQPSCGKIAAREGRRQANNLLVQHGHRGLPCTRGWRHGVRLLPGTELSFADEVKRSSPWPWTERVIGCKTAIFRQINKANPHTHHDALEFPNGQIVLLTFLGEGQQATVLQLPTTADVKAFRGEEPAYSDQVSGSR